VGEEGAIVEGAVEKVPEPDDVDDRWLDDDGRDSGLEPTPALGSAVWWCVSAGVMLLLPRQWASAGIAFGIAGVLALVKRRRYPPAKKTPAARKTPVSTKPAEEVPAEAKPADPEHDEGAGDEDDVSSESDGRRTRNEP